MAAAYAVLILFTLVWGAEYHLYKELTAGYPAITVGFWTFLIAALCLRLNMVVRPRPDPEPGAPVWRRLLLIAAIGIALNLCLLCGIARTSATNAAALSRSDVLFTLLIAALIAGERIRIGDLPWILAALVGTAVLLRFNPLEYRFGGLGDLLMLAHAALISVNAFLIKALARRVTRLRIAFVNVALNAAVLGILVAILDPDPLAFAKAHDGSLARMVLLGIFVYTWFKTYYYCLDHLPIWQVRIVTLLMPAVTAGLRFFLAGKTFLPHEITGMALLALGAAGVIYRHAGKRAGTAPDAARTG